MKRILKYIISFSFLFACYQTLQAQKGTILPSYLMVGTDVAYIGMSIFNPERSQFEINTSLDVYKFLLSIDYGLAEWNIQKPNFTYLNKGNYYRIGVDYNLQARDPDQNIFYVGLKYAHSNFIEDFSYQVTDPFYYDYENNINNADISAGWFEANIGMKVKVWKGLYLGWVGRFKFAKSVNYPPSSFENYWIPGYGKGENDTQWGFGYQILYRIPFRKKPPFNEKKVKEEK